VGEAAIVKRLVLEPNFAEVGRARRFVGRELELAPPDLIDDMQLIASELVSNAIEHGACDQVGLELTVSRTDVLMSVESQGFIEQLPRLEEWAMAPADQVTGRGLGIVRDLADAVQVVRNGESVMITVRRRLTPEA